MNRFVLVLAALSTCTLGATGIENPRCDQIGPGLYRIDYQASAGAGEVKVFASSRPDGFDSAKPLLTIQHPPADVAVPAGLGRVYFHLKPASGATRVVSIRRLPLEGASNFRDLGGYRTSDGQYVRWGLVYRSNHLANLNAKDYEYLKSLGIRLVCDVRTERERQRSPTRWMGPPPEFLTTPIESGAYNRYVIDDAPQYGVILRRLASGDLPAVEHCSGGKDRTGVFSALLLTALGVPRDVVIQDYLLTTEYVLSAGSIEKTTADLQWLLKLPQRPDAAFVKARMTTQPETLQAAFSAIDQAYGSFPNYLQHGLGISDSDLARLRQRLLER